jgi:hypothetical protein
MPPRNKSHRPLARRSPRSFAENCKSQPTRLSSSAAATFDSRCAFSLSRSANSRHSPKRRFVLIRTDFRFSPRYKQPCLLLCLFSNFAGHRGKRNGCRPHDRFFARIYCVAPQTCRVARCDSSMPRPYPLQHSRCVSRRPARSLQARMGDGSPEGTDLGRRRGCRRSGFLRKLTRAARFWPFAPDWDARRLVWILQ